MQAVHHFSPAALPHILQPMLRKFELRAPLEDADREAFLALPFRLQTAEANTYLLREGDRADRAWVLVSGFAMRHKVTVDGGRQIVSIHIPGDLLDLEGALLNVADHNIQMLTRGEVAAIPRNAIRELLMSNPRVAAAMWIDTLIDGSIFRERVVDIGRRDAKARIAHLLCELGRRQEVAGIAPSAAYELPMTQEQLADATGLTPVHVNRVLRSLDQDRLIVRAKRYITIPDWAGLRAVAGFNENYLHLDQIARGPAADRSI